MPNIKALLEGAGSLLKNKTLQTVAGGGAGLAGAEWENRNWMPDADSGLKGINDVAGGLTGMIIPHKPLLGTSLLTAKQLATYLAHKAQKATDAYTVDAPTRKAIADTQLNTASREQGTATINKDTAADQQEHAGDWTLRDKLLAGGLGLGAIGAGTYLTNSIMNRHKKKTARPADTVLSGDPKLRRPHKVRIDIPAESLPDEFYRSLVDADNRPRALSTIKDAAVLRLDFGDRQDHLLELADELL